MKIFIGKLSFLSGTVLVGLDTSGIGELTGDEHSEEL